MDAITYSSIGFEDLQARINQLNEANPDLQISVDKTGQAQATFTVTAGGKTYEVPCKLSLPQIDKPKGTSSTEELDEVVATLEECIEDLEALAETENQSSASTSISTASMFFNLYDAIALLKQTAQEQRKVALEVRQQQHEAVRESMLSEADMITDNAESAYDNAMALQIANTVVSAGALCASLGSAYAQRSAIKNSDAAKTNAQIDTLESASKEMSAASKEQAKINSEALKAQQAQKQVQKPVVEIEMVEIKETEVKQNAQNEVAPKAPDQPKAPDHPKVQDKPQSKPFNAGEQLPESELAKMKTETMKSDVTKAEDELKSAKQELTEAIKSKDSAKIQEAEAKVEQKAEKLAAAEAGYAQAMADEAGTMKTEIEAKKFPPGSDEAKAARKYQLGRLNEMSPDMEKYVKSAVNELNLKYDQQVKGAMESRKYQKAQNAITMTNQAFQTIQAGFGMLEAAQQKEAELERSKEKRKEAEQESIRADLEASNEEVQRTRDLIQDCNELIKSISESERQAALSISQRI